jgi:hypothetical protein
MELKHRRLLAVRQIPFTFNRTSMELKRVKCYRDLSCRVTFNRTSMELKHGCGIPISFTDSPPSAGGQADTVYF